jgi:NADPH2:quinone reductase
MRAVLLRTFGLPEELALADVADPIPGPGQVVIDVAVAGITFVETQLRSGHPPRPGMEPPLPVILGNGVGGVVSAVGQDADPAQVGRRVISTTGGSGGYAERVAVPAAGLIEIPGPLSTPEAVALLADGRTAMALIRAAGPRPGDRVLVVAAAGGVGSLLVQLAAATGAQVVAAAGTPRKVAVAKELGAAVAVDYTGPGWDAHQVDVVFDGVGGAIGEAAYRMLSPGGRFFGFGMASGSFAPAAEYRPNVTVTRGVPVTPDQMRELTIAALTEAAAGRLRPLVGQSFPLERAADAHAAMESRATIGKTLLVVR